MEERRNRNAVERERIKKAESVLVVGGGAVGVEVAGELANLFCINGDKGAEIKLTKRLGLVSRSEKLLPYFNEKASAAAKQFMIDNKVELFLNTTYNETFKLDKRFDYVIDCTGF